IGLVVLLAAGCSHSSRPPVASSPPKSQASRGAAVNPVNIKRVARDLPAGYEVTTAIPSAASPRVIWRLESGGTANPPQCAILADPGSDASGRDQSAQGVSGSGAGGIVDAVVVSVPGSASDHDVVADCGQWTLKAGHTSVSVRLTDAPHIDAAET